MMQRVALYGFVRSKDGLRARPVGVHDSKVILMSTGQDVSAVISSLYTEDLSFSDNDLTRHDQAIGAIFKNQVILPAKYPKILTIDALERSMVDMDKELCQVLKRITYKSEYYVRVYMSNPALVEQPQHAMYNTFARHVMEHAGEYAYKHYFPVLTQDGQEAEFVDYADTVVKHISQKLCSETTYWRGNSFHSDQVLFEAFFWVRNYKCLDFESHLKHLRLFYPNLQFAVSGPHPPYNFVQLELTEKHS